MRDPRLRRLLFFMIVGAVGYVIDAGISTSLVKIGNVSPFLARLPAFLVASLVTFAGNRRFTFADRGGPLIRGWLIYVGSTAFGALLNYGVYCAAIPLMQGNPWAVPLAIGLGAIVGLGVNFFCASTLVFKKQNPTLLGDP